MTTSCSLMRICEHTMPSHMNSNSTPDKHLVVARARDLRRNSTIAENKLWGAVRNRQLDGYKFRRQVAIGSFIADFCSLEKRLIIELDGSQHDERKNQDAARTHNLASRGFRVLRFSNDDVLFGIEGVLEIIVAELNKSS